MFGDFCFSEGADNTGFVMVAFSLEVIFSIFLPFIDKTMDNGLGFAALEDEDIANLKIFRFASPDNDDITFVKAILEREFSELFRGNIVLFVPRAAGFPVIVERIFKLRQGFSADLVVIEAMFHALGDNSNNRVRSAENEAKKRINDESDKEKGNNNIGNPAPRGITVPKKMPDFFEGFFKSHSVEEKEFYLKSFLYYGNLIRGSALKIFRSRKISTLKTVIDDDNWQ